MGTHKNHIDLLLILPKYKKDHESAKQEPKLRSAPLTLPYLASLVPPDVQVTIVDENVQEIDFEKPLDLVGISTITYTAPRAYQLSEIFRKKGAAVVLGGVHPSILPGEALNHADSIVIGEAEGIWQKLIMDYKNKNLQKIYRRDSNYNMQNMPYPRWDLMNRDAYFTTNVIETSRGCPHNCHFCCLKTYYGRNHRCRPVEDIIKEIKTSEDKLLGFVDADIVANPKFAKELFTSLLPLKKTWASDAGMNIARDKNLIKLASASGCKALFIGFESISTESLNEANKHQNIKNNFKETIHILHDHGISIFGGFIFGFDHDDINIFERTVEFAVKNKLDYADFNVLCPYPGTYLFEKMKKEERILTTDWRLYYGMCNVVFRPKLMTEDQLKEGCIWAWQQFYSHKSISKRFFSRHNFSSWLNLAAYVLLNINTRKKTLQFH